MFGHYITYHDIKVSYPDIIFIYPDIKLSYPDVKRVQSGVILYLALLLCTFTIIITTNTQPKSKNILYRPTI